MSIFDDLDRARRMRTGPGTKLRPGETWLLSVDGGSGTGRVWRLERGSPRTAGQVGFRGRASRSLEVASALARLEVPFLLDERSLPRRGPFRATAVQGADGHTIRALDGGSFGLAMVLAASSQLLGLALPSDLLATAGISESGRVEGVDGLDAKLGVLREHDWAAARLRVLVWAEQEELARELAGHRIDVIGVQNLREAMERAFEPSELKRQLQEAWEDEENREHAAKTFFRLAMDGNNHLLGWGSIARGAALLLDHAGDAPYRWQIEVARAIASRHDGTPSTIVVPQVRWNELRRPRKLTLLAHQVQACTDSCCDEWQVTLDAAAATLAAEGAEHAQDLALIGAIGRAHAAWGDYSKADLALRRALRGWLDLDAEPRSTHALCELLRVLACEGRAPDAEVREAVRRVRRDPRTEEMSLAFLAAALGRTWARSGERDQALGELEGETPWAHTPAHLRATRARWRAIASYEDAPAVARRCWVEIADVARGTPQLGTFADRLARLDRIALGAADERELPDAIEGLVQEQRLQADSRRILAFTGAETPQAQSEALRIHWRY